MASDDQDPKGLRSSGSEGSLGQGAGSGNPADTGGAGLSMDTPLNTMTLGELISVLRGISQSAVPYEAEVEGGTEASGIAGLEAGNQEAFRMRSARIGIASLVGSSPPAIQMAFLKGLAENEKERSRFMEDPVGFSKDHGVLLDETVISTALNTLVFDRPIDGAVLQRIGPNAAATLSGLRGPGNFAWPAAVAAIAAVVAAGAAVVSAVTSVMKDHASDIMRLKGLGPDGVRLPGARSLSPGAAMVMVTSDPPGAVLTGAAVTGAVLVASGAILGGRGLR